MSLHNFHKAALALALTALLSACHPSREVQYVQDLLPGTVETAAPAVTLTIEPGDLLSIIVTAKDPELATPFNLQPGTLVLDLNQNSSQSFQNQRQELGYRVDAEGNIIFPFLGQLHVAGLTRTQLEALIKSRIIKEGLLKDFSVAVTFLNARITILGDTRASNYPFPTDKYTILQALADAGDLNLTAKRQIKVIREKDGKRAVYEVDLRSRDLFDSPVYYLQQNDVIYVVPNEKKAAESDSNAAAWRTTGTWMGLASFAASITSIIIAITK